MNVEKNERRITTKWEIILHNVSLVLLQITELRMRIEITDAILPHYKGTTLPSILLKTRIEEALVSSDRIYCYIIDLLKVH